MRHHGSARLFQYWDKLRGNRVAPTRNSIEPADIRSLLPNIFILQKTQDQDILFRLAGTQICALMGQEFRGQAFSEIWETKSADRINDIVNFVLSSGKPVVVSADTLQPGRKRADIEIMILPLASELHKMDRVIGSLFVIDQSRSLLTEPIQKLILIGERMVLDDDSDMWEPDSQNGPHQIEIGAQKSQIGTFFQKVLHLRVFEGGKQR